MFFADRLTLGTPRRTKEGYMAVRARAARAGIYDYLGREIDPQGKHFQADQVVKVYRPAEEVFAPDAVHSFLLKPITDDHPRDPVTAKDWQTKAKGVNAGALRDGDYLAFDLVLMDAATIAKVEDGKRELSNGYSSEISVEDGVAPCGTAFQAVQRHIRGNHIALVDRGRAGSECRIGDVATCDAATVGLLERLLDQRTYSGGNGGDKNSSADAGASHVATKTITFDGLPLEVTDAAEAAIKKLQAQITALTADKTSLETKVGEHVATIATRDGEIVALKQQVKDADIGPDKLQQLVADRAQLVARAKAVDPKVVTDGKTDAEIRKAVVQAKLGDAAPTDDNGIAGAFTALTAGAQVEAKDALRDSITSGALTVADDGASVRNAARSLQYS